MSVATPISIVSQGFPVTFARRWFAVFVRMLWKEFRVVLPFLLVVAATMAGLAAIVVWAMRNQLHDAWGALYLIVVLFPLLFALGCGGMSYAGECEDGTWDWLRRIAAPPSAVCAAKIVVGLLCALILAIVAWLALAQFAWLPQLERSAVDASYRRLIVLLIGVSTTLLLSQIVSSLIKNVFVALIVSGVMLAPMLTIGLALGTDHTGGVFGTKFNEANFAPVWIGWIVALLGLITCEFSLADCWLKDVAPWRGGLISLFVNPIDRQRLMLSAWGYRQEPLAHLMSREWSLARPWLWALGLLPGIAIVSWGLRSAQRGYPRGRVSEGLWSVVTLPLGSVTVILLTLVPTLMGVWAYQPDQRDQRFRFLADRGISPTLIWLSKHLIRLPMLLLISFATWSITVMTIAFVSSGNDMLFLFSMFGAGLLFSLMSYAAGQLIGQLIRSPITSSFLAAVFALLLALWTHGLRLLDVSFVFDLIPVAILFAASWLRSPDWLLERTSWRARLQLGASLIIPFALLYGAVGWYRTSGLPRVARKPPTVAEMQPWHARKSEAESELERSLKKLDETYWDEFAAMKTELKSGGGALGRVPGFGQSPALELSSLCGEGEGRGRTAKIAAHLRELAVHPHSQVTVYFRDVYRRHYEKTRQQGQALSLVIWKPDHSRLRGDQRFQIPVELLELQAQDLLEQGAPDESLSLLWAAERVRDHRWYGGNAMSVQKFLVTAAQCKKSDLLRQFIRESNEMLETLDASKKELLWTWAHASDASDDARLLAGYGHETIRNWLVPTTPASQVLMRLFPWELSVVRREVSVYLARELAVAEAIDDVIHDRAANRIGWQVNSWPNNPNTTGRFLPANSELERPIRPTGLLSAIPDEEAQRQLFSPQLRSDPLSSELERRQFVLLLALIAWHHDHGELPESLDQLVGPYFDKLPLDPLTAKPFVYQRFPTPSVLPPCVLEKRVPQLRVRSLDDTHDLWLELRIEYTPHRLPDKLFAKIEAEK